MEYFDEKIGRTRQTLEQFLRPGETREDIIFGKRHEWVTCSHYGVGSRGSHPLCDKISPYLTLTHQVSATVRNVERFGEKMDEMVLRVLLERRSNAEILFP